jgi:hypothetical protein
MEQVERADHRGEHDKNPAKISIPSWERFYFFHFSCKSMATLRLVPSWCLLLRRRLNHLIE